MNHLFAYGTLMCDEIMQEVSGHQPASVNATLEGYVRRTVRGEQYPAIKPLSGSHVEGLVYMNIADDGWRRLDRFEGDLYVRTRVQLTSAENTPLIADTYVIRPAFYKLLCKKSWDYEDFLRTGKVDFQRMYQGYFQL